LTVRIGTGAGYSGSRVRPALQLVDAGVDYLIFECLAERTIALAQLQKHRSPKLGYDPHLETRMPPILRACAAQGIRIVTNMGAANPIGAARRIRELAQDEGLHALRVAVVTGDDVLNKVRNSPQQIEEAGVTVAELGDRLISANAYCGAEGIVEALVAGADVVVTGRVADPSLFLGVLIHEFGWSQTDWNALARGTLIGHLLECSAQVSGGYFADPGYQEVPNLAEIGFPYADVEHDGTAVIAKPAGTGGEVSVATCTEQLFYEVFDPAAYVTPDVTADFSQVRLSPSGDGVAVSGALGYPAPDQLKVSVGYHDGFIGEAEISYGGPGALSRARLAADVVRLRLEEDGVDVDDLAMSLIGVDSLYQASLTEAEPGEVRFRVAGRTKSESDAIEIGREVEALYATGPYGGGGVRRWVQEVISIGTVFVPRTDVAPAVALD
jgi:hypothetical protein